MARPRKNIVALTDEEVQRLRDLLRKTDTTQTVANRCRILLDLDENHQPVPTQAQCAARHGICRATVNNVVSAFCKEGLDAVLTLKRNPNSDNGNRKVDGRIEAALITLACGPVPEGYARWSIRLLEREAKVILDEPLGRETIRRVLKKAGLDLTDPNTGVCQKNRMPNS